MNNVLILAGRITKELELRYTTNNKAILNIPIAVNNGKDDTTFINITAFGQTAEMVNKYCNKGDLLGVQAIVKNHNWEDEKGNKHYDLSFIANKITFLQPKKNDNQSTVNETAQNEVDPFAEFGEQISIEDNFLE